MNNKRGISPLIATVLIIGFTIVLAAIAITWGTNLFKKTQEGTANSTDISLACTEVIGSLDIKASLAPLNRQLYPNPNPESAGINLILMGITVENNAARSINGFNVRIFNKGATIIEVVDTSNVKTYPYNSTDNSTQIVKYNEGIGVRDYSIPGNSIQSFVLLYNNSLITEPVRLEFKPNVVIEGISNPCPGNGISRDFPK